MNDYLIAKSTSRNTAIIPVVVTIICLAPFVNKAFHIDDPMFIWPAKHIQAHPADFYGFTVNWYGYEQPMTKVQYNPPATCYYIALIGVLFGWSEIALHMAFLLPAVAVALGTYYLARQFCSQPTLAALAVVLTPAFLVSSTNIMCDMMMLSLWVWAAILWVQGIKANRQLNLFLAAVLMAVCVLTKFSGIYIALLAFIYSLTQRRKLGTWTLFLLIPVMTLVGYQLATRALYGHGLLWGAVPLAAQTKWVGSKELFSKGLTGLAFIGGGIVTALFYIPLLWSRRVLGAGFVITILIIFALTFVAKIGGFSTHDTDGVRWGSLIQLGLMVAAGVSLLGVGALDFWKCRDADSLLLLLWVFGNFIFASFITWTINVRYILPIAPAGSILLMRQVERRFTPPLTEGRGKQARKNWRLAWPLVPAAILTLSLCWADYTWANTARDAANSIHKKFESWPGNIWFQGHWGFQYYMEDNGYKAYDFKNQEVKVGDIIVIPSNNCFTETLPEGVARLGGVYRATPCRWLAITNRSLGAGFYADRWGPLPFAIGPVGPEEYRVFIVTPQKEKS
jgi:4-amino-4-deoxy-L-arabinose transferase-like glycosyltransferase